LITTTSVHVKNDPSNFKRCGAIESRGEAVDRAFFGLLDATERLNAPIRNALIEEGLSTNHLMLLRILIDEGPTSGAKLADGMMITSPAVTWLVTKLEAQGLVTRYRDPVDHRIILIEATKKAGDRFRNLNKNALNELTRVFRGWDTSEIEQLQSLLNRLSRRRVQEISGQPAATARHVQ
jgi:DNA-binding MarR family transcriptional regulator